MLGLLGMTTLYYVFAGRRTEAMDSVTWYVLLVLFLAEGMRWAWAKPPRALLAMRAARMVATGVLVLTLALYLRERQWLDALNMALWLSVVALMEVEVRSPAFALAHRSALSRSAMCLYAALALVVLVWLFQLKWIDAWDATLWLISFGVLELNLLSRGEAQPDGSTAAGRV